MLVEGNWARRAGSSGLWGGEWGQAPWGQAAGCCSTPRSAPWGRGAPAARQGRAKALLVRQREGSAARVLIWLRVPNGLEEREWLTPGRKAPLLRSTQ